MASRATVQGSVSALPALPLALQAILQQPRPFLSTLAASKTTSAGGATDPEALVTGFHWAFAGGAAFVLAGLVTMLVLLRRQHVARIEAEATAAPVPAA